MKTIIYTHDPMLTMVYTDKEAIDVFGQEHVEEYGIEVPDTLAIEFTQTYEKLIQLSQQLEKIKKDNKI